VCVHPAEKDNNSMDVVLSLFPKTQGEQGNQPAVLQT